MTRHRSTHQFHKINTDNAQTTTLRGEKNNTEEAKKDILNIIDTITEEPQQKQPCRYFQQGNCRKLNSGASLTKYLV